MAQVTEETPKHSHIWMIATIIILVLAAVGVIVYLQRIKGVEKVNQSQTETKQEVASQPQPVTIAPTEQAKTISEEVKKLDLAEIKASISEIQSILGAL